jgi:hypothetical protein
LKVQGGWVSESYVAEVSSVYLCYGVCGGLPIASGSCGGFHACAD